MKSHAARRHGIVSGIHNTAQLPPIDRPADLRKDNPALARSFRHRIPQPPAPRGRRDRACSQDSLSPYWANESWSFFFLGYRIFKRLPSGAPAKATLNRADTGTRLAGAGPGID